MNYQKELERIAQRYRDEGYVVVTYPDKDHVAGLTDVTGVDLLATRGTERVLVQVKQTRADLERNPDILRQAEIVNSRPGWRYDLVVLESDDPLRRLGPEPTVDQINQILCEAQNLQPRSPWAAF